MSALGQVWSRRGGLRGPDVRHSQAGPRPPEERSWPSAVRDLRRTNYAAGLTRRPLPAAAGNAARPGRPARVTNPGIPSLRNTVQALRSGPEHHTMGLSVIPGVTTGRKTTAPGSVGTNREVPRLAVRGGTEPGAVPPCPVTAAAKAVADRAWPAGSAVLGYNLGAGSFIYRPRGRSFEADRR
jgi:hypothetical protein